jgi:hypothetical protein
MFSCTHGPCEHPLRQFDADVREKLEKSAMHENPHEVPSLTRSIPLQASGGTSVVLTIVPTVLKLLGVVEAEEAPVGGVAEEVTATFA